MTKHVGKRRQFEVYSDRDMHTARVITEQSLEAASVAFLEEFGLATMQHDEHQLTLYVRDLEGGHSHCFKIDLHRGGIKECE